MASLTDTVGLKSFHRHLHLFIPSLVGGEFFVLLNLFCIHGTLLTEMVQGSIFEGSEANLSCLDVPGSLAG